MFRYGFLLAFGILSTATPALARHTQVGLASWYGPGFEGKKTSNGDIFSSRKLTAAHNTLPLGTKVRVTNLKNHQSIVVKINDHGSFDHKYHRLIDLSRRAASALHMVKQGVTPVKVEVIAKPSSKRLQIARR